MSSGKQIIREREENMKQFLEYADESRKAGMYTDICIKAGTKSFRVHRMILSYYSKYFRSMFQMEMEEKYADTLQIKGVNETSLELLINFIYTGKLFVNWENVCELLNASKYLQIDKSKQSCFDFLSDSISAETWFQVLKVACSNDNDNLRNKIFQFVNNNFSAISSTNDFKLQSKRSLLYVLSQLDSYRVLQRLVYDAIIGWVKHEESRKHDFAELFEHLDLSKFSSSFLTRTVSTEILVIENQSCSSSVLKTLAMKLEELVFNHSFKILSIGGTKTPNKISVVYNSDHQNYPALPQEFCAHYTLKVDEFVYCIGGKNVDSSPNKVYSLKLYEANMDWERKASMIVGRDFFAAAAYRNGIAVVGGISRDARNSAEFYDPSTDEWSKLAPMNNSRCEPALVMCSGCLFCLGGYQENNDNERIALSSVEHLCDVNGSWQPFAPMQTNRSVFAAVNCMDTIYAIGGRDDQLEVIRSVEKYDFDSKKWVYVDSMKIERREHSACVVQEKIFVVGGTNANNQLVSEIECYDPHNDKWTVVGNTNEELLRHTIIAI